MELIYPLKECLPLEGSTYIYMTYNITYIKVFLIKILSNINEKTLIKSSFAHTDVKSINIL